MQENEKNGHDFGALGIIVGVVLIITLIWVAVMSVFNDDSAGDGITWVG